MGLCIERRLKSRWKSALPAHRPAVSPGFKALVPGLTQLSWNQRDRGLVLLVSFLSSLAAMILFWGNMLSWLFLGFAFLTHSASMLDVVRQRAFPVIHFSIPLAAISLTIGLTVYVPSIQLLRTYAFPVTSVNAPGTRYLVNRRAYQENEPVPGDWVWMHDREYSHGLAGQVIAVAGQEVEWTGRQWRVDGKNLSFMHPGTLPFYPASLRFQVPRDHVLIDQEMRATLLKSQPLAPLAMVSRDQIFGRAWARCYPFWDRCLL